MVHCTGEPRNTRAGAGLCREDRQSRDHPEIIPAARATDENAPERPETLTTMRNRIRKLINTDRTIFPAVYERLAADPHAEVPGPDGIRHQLVARIKAEIAAGTYLTDEKWLAAESRLLRTFGDE